MERLKINRSGFVRYQTSELMDSDINQAYGQLGYVNAPGPRYGLWIFTSIGWRRTDSLEVATPATIAQTKLDERETFQKLLRANDENGNLRKEVTILQAEIGRLTLEAKRHGH